ncbi:EamA family transporter [Pedobacter zeae]|uniref:Inner membrane transporter RhtA n=1 Tax=Pedobacter zeae TaxID=1737356 RepID=A0A7W6P7T9_9SPHI|nr:DMT family transporter [Pedobacter zeae]MBB4109284.1 inner membrane transporter RhtA [Pedobacter zeae]GGH11423.1 threonine transporter RhtB [Pedobacter zeae]
MKSKINIPPIPAVLLSIISVQCGAAIAKTLFPEIGAAATASLRIGLSAVILLITFRPNLFKLTAKQWKYTILYGVCLGVMNMVFYMSIARIPIGLGVTLEFVGPLALAIFGSKKAIDFVWVILAATGIILITPWTGNGLNLAGILLALLAGLFWAGYIILGGRISKIMKGGDAVAIGMIFATLVILPFGISGGGLSHLNPGLVGLGAALALLSSAIPFTLEMRALKQLPARTFSILMSLEPAMASLAALVFLQEYLTLKECLAVAFVVIASTGSSLTTKRAKL